jgi:hypothetical protein
MAPRKEAGVGLRGALNQVGNRLAGADRKVENRISPLDRIVEAGPVTTGVGQRVQQKSQVTSAQTDQPLVRPRDINRGARKRFKGSDPGPDNPNLTNVAAGARSKANLPVPAESKPQALERTALKSKETPSGKVLAKDASAAPAPVGRGTRGRPAIRLKGQGKKKNFNIFNLQGIENIFNSAGELASFFASSDFQEQQRIARTQAATSKNRISELKSLDSSIEALSGAIADVGFGSEDAALKTTLSGQLAEAVRQRREVSGGLGGGRRGLDTSTVEGFATQLKDLGFSDDETRTFTNRKFAGAA